MDLRIITTRSLLGVALFASVSGGRAADAIESLQNAATEWARLRAETVRLESDWEWQHELMGSTLTALQERIVALENQRDIIAARTAGTRREAAGVTAKRDELASQWAIVEARVQMQCDELVRLRPWLPPRLAQALALPYRSLSDPALGASERLQYVVVVLSRCTQFNQSVTFTEETLAFEAGENPRLLEVLYWGLSHGYALDRARGRAYIGFPGQSGWTWEIRADMAGEVARLLDTYHDKVAPDFVTVPARVHDPFAGIGKTADAR